MELAAIVRRFVHSANIDAALLFNHVNGCKWPVLTNLFSSKMRINQLVGGQTFSSLFELSDTLDKGINSFTLFSTWLQGQEDLVTVAGELPAQDELNGLDQLPALQVWPKDGGHYLSMAVVICRALDGEELSCGLYRVQVHGNRLATIHWRAGSDGARLFASYQNAGVAMPVTIVLGCEPALTYSAAFPLPPGCSEFNFAAFLQQQPIMIHDSSNSDIPVPATSEFVLEGVVSAKQQMYDGPFGNHQGFYTDKVLCPLFELKQLTARKDAIFPASIVGPPPSESSVIGASFIDFILPLMQREIEQLVDIYMPQETVYHGCALIRLRVDAMIEQVKSQIIQAPMFRNSKLLVFVDEYIDVKAPARVLWRIMNQSLNDVVQFKGGKMVIDATRWNKGARRLLNSDPDTEQLLNKRWAEYGLGSMVGDNQ